jgi:hypothetical protein
MKWIADIVRPKPLHFEIEPEELPDIATGAVTVEYKLYVYENGVDTHDYLQETLEIAMDQAFEDFGVPKNAWRQVNE